MKIGTSTELLDWDSQDFCVRCDPHVLKAYNCGRGRWWGKTGKTADIVFVGEAPGGQEVLEGNFFVGRAGMELSSWIQEAGIEKKKIWLDNAVRCGLVAGDLGRMQTVHQNKVMSQCKPYLIRELHRLKPKVIVALGNSALATLTGQKGISGWRGKIVHHEETGAKIVPTFHPAAILRDPAPNRRLEALADLRLAASLLEKAPRAVKKPKWNFVQTERELDRMLRELTKDKTKPLVVDLETVGLDPFAPGSEIIGVALTDRVTEGWFVPILDFDLQAPVLNSHGKEVKNLFGRWEKGTRSSIWAVGEARIRKLIQNRKRLKIAHNAGFEVRWLGSEGRRGISDIDLWPLYDTMIVNAVLDGKKGNDLKSMAWIDTGYGGYEDPLGALKRKIVGAANDYSLFPVLHLAEYGCYDVTATLLSYKNQAKEIEKHPAAKIAAEFHELRYNLSQMEITGMRVDVDYVREESLAMEKRLLKAKKSLRTITGRRDFNPNSNPQLQGVLFGPEGMFRLADLKMSEPSGDSKAVERMVSWSRAALKKAQQKPRIAELKKKLKFLEALQEWRDLSKLRGTYLAPFLERSGWDTTQRIHPSFKTASTWTQRLSCADPNLQNIPRGEVVRTAVIARPGYKLVEFDYSQLEIRIAAEYSQDDQWIELLNSGADIHRFVGVNTIKKPNGDDYKESDFEDGELRAAAKVVGFSIIYGKTAKGLGADLGVTESEAEAIIENLLNTFPGLRVWIESQHQFVRQHGFVETLTGRRLHVPNSDSWKRHEVEKAFRQAVNYPVQSAASDCVILAINRIFRALRKKKINGIPFLTVHDSIMFEVPEKEVGPFARAVKAIMEEPISFLQRVQLKVDCKVGDSWGKAQKLKIA